MNASFNTATNCVPFEAIYGRKGMLGFPDLNQTTAESAEEYSKSVVSTLEDIHKAVKVATEVTDSKYLADANQGHLRQNLKIGDKCLLFRPLATTATKKSPWIDDFEVIDADPEGLILKVRNLKTKKSEWVSLHHVRQIKERPARLTPDTDWLDLDEPVIVSSPAESKGGIREVSLTPKVNPATPPTTTPTSSVTQSTQSTTSNPLEPSQSSPTVPRRLSRTRAQTKSLNIQSTKGKTYAQVCRRI